MPSVVTPIVYCQNATSIALNATGTLLKWYTVPIGGTGSSTAIVPSTTTPGTTIYYVSQTSPITGCEGTRASISVTINPLPSLPIVTTPLNLCVGGPSASIGAVGTSLKWYTSAVGGIGSTSAPVATSSTIGTTNYYVSQTSSDGCEGPRANIVVVVHDLPVLNITSLSPSGFVYCRGKSITLKATSPKAISFQWEFVGKKILGAIYDTVISDSTGKWGVTVSDSFGCKSYKDVFVNRDTSSLPVLTPKDVYKCEETTILLTCHPGYATYSFQLFKDGIPESPPRPKENIKSILDSGIYYVVMTNNFGCIDTSNTSIVKFYPKPSKPIITLKGTILETFGVYHFYQWYKNDKPIIGAHATKINTTGIGYYFLEVTDINGCLNQSDTIFVNNSTSINSVSIKGQLKIYPNPTQDRVIIESPIKINVVVVDFVGKMIFEGKNVESIDMSNYADGTYLLRIFDENNNLIGIEKVSKISNR
jgi:hypothetical protein